jgi:hypothetical protein
MPCSTVLLQLEPAGGRLLQLAPYKCNDYRPLQAVSERYRPLQAVNSAQRLLLCLNFQFNLSAPRARLRAH